jgi:hypothetical protein
MTDTTANRAAMSGELTPIEYAMIWEKMSGERLSDAERQRIMDGGDFVPPATDAQLTKPHTHKDIKPMPVDALDDARLCALEIIRCYSHPDRTERDNWWAQDYEGEPTAENALRLVQKELLG